MRGISKALPGARIILHVVLDDADQVVTEGDQPRLPQFQSLGERGPVEPLCPDVVPFVVGDVPHDMPYG